MNSDRIIDAAERFGLGNRDFIRWVFDTKPALVAIPFGLLALIAMFLIAMPLALLVGVLRAIEISRKGQGDA